MSQEYSTPFLTDSFAFQSSYRICILFNIEVASEEFPGNAAQREYTGKWFKVGHNV